LDIVPQFEVTLNARQHISAAAELRIPLAGRSSRATELVFYLLWDRYDGGVPQGWRARGPDAPVH
jgi:hypothetical protein